MSSTLSVVNGRGVPSSMYCVFPGNRNSGYCLLKLNAATVFPRDSSWYKEVLNWEIPPRYGGKHDRTAILKGCYLFLFLMYSELRPSRISCVMSSASEPLMTVVVAAVVVSISEYCFS